MNHETAYAKINLALHVRRRREDGYHEIETLFAFVDAGDELVVREAEVDCFTIGGEFAAGLTIGPDNLVLGALAKMRRMVSPGSPPVPSLAIHLQKNLPVAAGIGGGSADAAAMIRLLDREYVRNGDNRELVLSTTNLGADVGACIISRTRIGRGLGWELHEAQADDLVGTPVLLVNPRIPLATGPVFAAWDGTDHGALPDGPVSVIAQQGRNDLEAPAITLVPEIGMILAELRATGAEIARMSGSGATCFATYRSHDVMREAAGSLASSHPGWWQMQGRLR